MKKFVLISIFALAGLAGGAGLTSCNVDADFQGTYNVYDIQVAANEWKIPNVGDYMYVDKPMAELSSAVFGNASYTTYYVFKDGNETVETPLPYNVYNETTGGQLWEYTISSEYSRDYLRIKVASSNFNRFTPSETMHFRLAIVR